LTKTHNDQVSAKICHIKRALIDAIGESSLAELYVVKGETAERTGISLDRELFLNQLIRD
jgi:hypothetical protein